MRDGVNVFSAIETLVHEVAELAKRLGMRQGPVRSRLLDNRIWLNHSTPEHGSAAGFVVRDYYDFDCAEARRSGGIPGFDAGMGAVDRRRHGIADRVLCKSRRHVSEGTRANAGRRADV